MKDFKFKIIISDIHRLPKAREEQMSSRMDSGDCFQISNQHYESSPQSTGPFLNPKLFILTYQLNFYYTLKCCFDCSFCRTRCELKMAILLRS